MRCALGLPAPAPATSLAAGAWQHNSCTKTWSPNGCCAARAATNALGVLPWPAWSLACRCPPCLIATPAEGRVPAPGHQLGAQRPHLPQRGLPVPGPGLHRKRCAAAAGAGSGWGLGVGGRCKRRCWVSSAGHGRPSLQLAACRPLCCCPGCSRSWACVQALTRANPRRRPCRPRLQWAAPSSPSC